MLPAHTSPRGVAAAGDEVLFESHCDSCPPQPLDGARNQTVLAAALRPARSVPVLHYAICVHAKYKIKTRSIPNLDHRASCLEPFNQEPPCKIVGRSYSP